MMELELLWCFMSVWIIPVPWSGTGTGIIYMTLQLYLQHSWSHDFLSLAFGLLIHFLGSCWRDALSSFDSRRSCLDMGAAMASWWYVWCLMLKSSICFIWFVILSLHLLLSIRRFQQANIYTSTCARPSESEGDCRRRIPQLGTNRWWNFVGMG